MSFYYKRHLRCWPRALSSCHSLYSQNSITAVVARQCRFIADLGRSEVAGRFRFKFERRQWKRKSPSRRGNVIVLFQPKPLLFSQAFQNRRTLVFVVFCFICRKPERKWASSLPATWPGRGLGPRWRRPWTRDPSTYWSVAWPFVSKKRALLWPAVPTPIARRKRLRDRRPAWATYPTGCRGRRTAQMAVMAAKRRRPPFPSAIKWFAKTVKTVSRTRKATTRARVASLVWWQPANHPCHHRLRRRWPVAVGKRLRPAGSTMEDSSYSR